MKHERPLHAQRPTDRLAITKHRCHGSWLVTAFGLASREYATWPDAIEGADGMAWALACRAHRHGLDGPFSAAVLRSLRTR